MPPTYRHTRNCTNCNKELRPEELRDHASGWQPVECSECLYHLYNGTRTIKAYNKWLGKGQANTKEN